MKPIDSDKIKKFNIDEVLNCPIKKGRMIIDGYKIRNSSTLKVFREKGVACIFCNIKGLYFEKKLSEMLLYTDKLDKCGRRIYLTRDHIIPRSFGGSNNIKNLVPMCNICNEKKGSKFNIKEYKYCLNDIYNYICVNIPYNISDDKKKSIRSEYSKLRKGYYLNNKRSFMDVFLNYSELKKHKWYLAKKFGFTFPIKKILKVPD